MNHLCRMLLTSCALLPIDGCLDFLQPTQTTIQLVNDASFAVEVTIYISDTQEIPRALLTTTGEKIERTVNAGTTVTIVRDCDELQAIVIDDADLQIIVGIGPEADTEVLRDGTDFGCGDTIRFTFSSTLLPPSLDIDVSYPG